MQTDKDPGLGSKFSKPVKRFLNPDGSYNINRIGGVKGFRDFYTFLLDSPWYVFLFILLGLFCLLNICFASLYLLNGVEGLSGKLEGLPSFWSAFFFSCQTFTTLGYGGMQPGNLTTNVIASVESFTGILSAALATGALYGRLSKPKARIAFSDKILLSQVKEENVIMFKIVNLRHNVLLRTKVNCIFIIDSDQENLSFNKDYHKMPLEVDFILFFPLTWTIVHKIDQESPFLNLSLEELIRRNGEVVVFLETFDETFGVEIIQKHSYAGAQWAKNLKFDSNFNSNQKGQIDLHIRNLNKTSPV